jgi:hypothetical protein
MLDRNKDVWKHILTSSWSTKKPNGPGVKRRFGRLALTTPWPTLWHIVPLTLKDRQKWPH